MTGLYDGIEIIIFKAILVLLLNPLLTVLFLKKIGVFSKLKDGTIKAISILIFSFLVILSLLLIRIYLYIALDWLILYFICIGLVYIIILVKRRDSGGGVRDT